MSKDAQVIGHMARKVSTMCYLFLQKGGTISCVVMGTRWYSYDLPQGNMEMMCLLKFCGNNNIVQKVKKLLQEKDKDIPIAEVPLKELPTKIFKSSESSSMGSRAASGKADVWATLQNGDELSDKRMQFAQKLIKEQFPLIGGVCSTLLQDKSFNLPQNSLQIIHCSERHHWIAAFNIGCPHNSVNIYDSLFNDLDAATYQIIKNMYGGDECEVSMRKVQVQAGVKDCGVFAIPFMTSIVHEEDPCIVFKDGPIPLFSDTFDTKYRVKKSTDTDSDTDPCPHSILRDYIHIFM